MPSAEHESPIALTYLEPDMVAWMLAKLFELKTRDHHRARPQPTDVRVLVPHTYHADSVTVFYDADDQPLYAAVLEVQRGWDRTKRRTWQLYVAHLEAELDVNVALLVYCPNPAIARRYREMFASETLSLSLRPFIFTPNDIPLVVDVDEARAQPSVAVLSALCHGGHADVDEMFPALAEALLSVGPEKAILYYDIVLAGLPEAARVRWEAFMTTVADYKFRSELLRNLAAEAKAEGKAEGKKLGEAQAVLTVLEARGVLVPKVIREQILECTDLAKIETWLRRAGNATSIDDVISE